MELGLQTFTIREKMKTFPQAEQTLRELAALGIRNVELAVDYLRFPFTVETAKRLAELFEKHAISVRSCQIKYAATGADPAKTAAYLHSLGAAWVTNSVIDLKLLTQGAAAVRRYCDALNQLQSALEGKGIHLCHHNHHYEFLKYEGKSVLSLMAESFTGSFALDTYWCQKGGGNVLTLLEDLSGRVKILHLRDYGIQPFGLLSGGKDTEAGNGNLPFRQILEKAMATGVLYGMVEQKTKKPMESIKQSWKYLQPIWNSLQQETTVGSV